MPELHTYLTLDQLEDAEYVYETLSPIVDAVNEYIELLKTFNEEHEAISVSDLLLPLVERVKKTFENSTLSETVVQCNPELAIELELISLREAIREGLVPLTKQHVLDKIIHYNELSKEIIEKLDFTPDDYKRLGV